MGIYFGSNHIRERKPGHKRIAGWEKVGDNKVDMNWRKQIQAIGLITVFGLTMPWHVQAQTSSSNTYRIEEAQFGSGGEVESCSSGQFCAQSSLGSLGVGSSSSNSFDAEAGFLTQNEPYLEFVVQTNSIDLGVLDSTTTGADIGLFYVRTYLSGSYSVVTMSQPPTSESGSQLNAMGTTAASAPGTEQFGINLRNNTTPNVGVDPVNVPDGTFADGTAFGDGPGGSRDYDDIDGFAYGVGDTIARSAATATNPAVGRTEYTISYIANISPITEAGTYVMNHDMVAVATF